jgi:hypothetical protein
VPGPGQTEESAGRVRPRDAKLLPGRGSGSGSRVGYAAAYLSLGVPLGVRSCTFDRAAQDLALFLKMSGGGPLSPFIFCPSLAHSIPFMAHDRSLILISLNPFNTFSPKKKLSTDKSWTDRSYRFPFRAWNRFHATVSVVFARSVLIITKSV